MSIAAPFGERKFTIFYFVERVGKVRIGIISRGYRRISSSLFLRKQSDRRRELTVTDNRVGLGQHISALKFSLRCAFDIQAYFFTGGCGINLYRRRACSLFDFLHGDYLADFVD